MAWLESFIIKLKGASNDERDRMLFEVNFGDHLTTLTARDGPSSAGTVDSLAATSAARHAYLHPDSGGLLVYHGPTSIYHLSTNKAEEQEVGTDDVLDAAEAAYDSHLSYVTQHFDISLEDELITNALLHFFKWQYPHFMFIYREAFLRDHFSEQPRRKYWSGSLLLALCALGLLMMDRPEDRESSERFFAAAESILLVAGLAQPCITNVQAFLCLAYYEIGRGSLSKGWEYSGMLVSLERQSEPILLTKVPSRNCVSHGPRSWLSERPA